MSDKKEGKKGKKKGKKKAKEVERVQEDPLSASAMEKAYFMCANAAQFLAKRDMPWPLAKSEKPTEETKKWIYLSVMHVIKF